MARKGARRMKFEVKVFAPPAPSSTEVYTFTVDAAALQVPADAGLQYSFWCEEITVDRTGTFTPYTLSVVGPSQILVGSSSASSSLLLADPLTVFSLWVLIFVFCFSFALRKV